MKKLMSTFPEYDFLMHHELAQDEHVTLLGKGEEYAVCTIQPRRMIAMSPNYLANGNGLLTGPLTRAGLTDLLQWTDRATATQRFRDLAKLPANVVALFP